MAESETRTRIVNEDVGDPNVQMDEILVDETGKNVTDARIVRVPGYAGLIMSEDPKAT